MTLLHAFHTASSGREWIVPLMMLSGLGVAGLGRLLSHLRRSARRGHDEPV